MDSHFPECKFSEFYESISTFKSIAWKIRNKLWELLASFQSNISLFLDELHGIKEKDLRTITTRKNPADYSLLDFMLIYSLSTFTSSVS